jgi:hypothetical protein
MPSPRNLSILLFIVFVKFIKSLYVLEIVFLLHGNLLGIYQIL